MNATAMTTPSSAWSEPRGSPFEIMSADSAFIDNVNASSSLVGRSGRHQPLEIYIPASQGNLLYSLVRYLRPQQTLEVGMANGISSLYIAQALHDLGDGRHLAIDPFQQSDWKKK